MAGCAGSVSLVCARLHRRDNRVRVRACVGVRARVCTRVCAAPRDWRGVREGVGGAGDRGAHSVCRPTRASAAGRCNEVGRGPRASPLDDNRRRRTVANGSPKVPLCRTEAVLGSSHPFSQGCLPRSAPSSRDAEVRGPSVPPEVLTSVGGQGSVRTWGSSSETRPGRPDGPCPRLNQSVSCLKDLLGETRVSAQMLRRVLHQSVLRASA